MLSNINRLRKKQDFAKTFRFGKSFNSGNLSLKIVEARGRIRFGFVISNKIDKRATRRNALKRRLRAAAREIFPQLTGSYNVVTLVKKNYDWPYDYELIKNDLVKALVLAGKIKK